ncbi:MAG: hypothetical protein EOO46_01455 [Flavobacterium sp.]|nr:MAG: hypothetical protein EOO46_01455 [Flavobacterium sp.]
MKSIIKTTALAMVFALTACSSDDGEKRVEEPISERLEYEFTNQIPIPDGSGTLAIISLEVDADEVVIDPSKVHIEITLEHELAIDVSYGYLMPNDGDEFRTIVNKLGGYNKYSAQNVLSFNPENTQVINVSENFNYPENTIPQGDYKEGTNDADFPVETPLFKSMMNKNINGTWKFFFIDDFEQDEGKVVKIKLIFDEGALQVNEM